MKKITVTVALLVALVATTLHTQAQTTKSEGNAANTAQSKTGNAKDNAADPVKSRQGVSRVVTGVRPDSNATSNKFGRSSKQASREARSPSDADGNVSTQVKAKANPDAKKKRSKGRSFGNTGPEN